MADPDRGVIASIATNALYILAVHRYRLLGWTPETKKVPLRLGQRERRFIAFAFIVVIITQTEPLARLFLYQLPREGSPLQYLNFSVPLWVLSIPVITLFLAPIFALVFPAIALDDPRPFSTARTMSRGIYWRLFGIIFSIGLPGVLVTRYVVPAVAPIFRTPLFLFVTYVTVALFAIALCFVYQDRLLQGHSVKPQA